MIDYNPPIIESIPRSTIVTKNTNNQALEKGKIASALGKILKHIYGP